MFAWQEKFEEITEKADKEFFKKHGWALKLLSFVIIMIYYDLPLTFIGFTFLIQAALVTLILIIYGLKS